MFSVTEVWHMTQSQFLPLYDIEKDIKDSRTNNIIQHGKDKEKKNENKKKKREEKRGQKKDKEKSQEEINNRGEESYRRMGNLE